MYGFRMDIAARRRMMWRLAMLPVLCLMVCGHARAGDDRPVTLPFSLHGVYIYMKAAVNDKPVNLILDSGAGVNALTPEAAKRLGLKAGTDLTPVKGAGGVAPPVSIIEIGKLAVGKASLEGQPAALIPLPEALFCDGLLGASFLHMWVVTVDYAASRLTLTPHGSFIPDEKATAFPLRLINNTPHIEATADGCHGWFNLDTGAGDSVTLFGPFVEKNQLRGKYMPAIRTVTGSGVGGLIYGDVIRLHAFEMGKFRFEQPTATLSRQTTGVFADTEVAGNIGGEILRRFTVTFDYPNRKIYLTPNALYETPFIGYRSGLGIDYVNKAFVVLSVLPNSPGAEAGVKNNETVLAVDDRPAAKIKPWEMNTLFKRDPGTKVRLKLRDTDGTVRDVTLTLRDLL